MDIWDHLHYYLNKSFYPEITYLIDYLIDAQPVFKLDFCTTKNIPARKFCRKIDYLAVPEFSYLFNIISDISDLENPKLVMSSKI